MNRFFTTKLSETVVDLRVCTNWFVIAPNSHHTVKTTWTSRQVFIYSHSNI